MENRSNSDPAISLLLVEDDEATLQCLAIILAKRYPQLAVATADNGRAGLELFQGRPAAIVITDFNMPEMDGMEMTGRIRAIRPETRSAPKDSRRFLRWMLRLSQSTKRTASSTSAILGPLVVVHEPVVRAPPR